MERTIKVFDPTAKPRDEEIRVNPSVHNLDKKVVGFLWNNKPNGDILLLRIKEKLLQRFQVAGTAWQHWEGGNSELETRLINELAAAADTVVVAIGD